MSIKPLPYQGPTTVPGFLFAGIHAGIKRKPESLDLALLQVSAKQGATVAGIFTENRVKAAPVLLDMERLARGKCRAVIINSGNANACTGEQGYQDAVQMAAVLAKSLSCPEKEIMVGSTGVIGQVLPMEKISAAIPALIQNASEKNLSQAAHAIRTTDTFEKIAGSTCVIDGKTITVCGIAKGSGMISPQMATMLGYLFTDAVISSEVLQRVLEEASAQTFNAITVDGEMSTNDTVLFLASGAANHAAIQAKSKAYDLFLKAVIETTDLLARQIVRDGEGSTKFVELEVSGIENQEQLKVIAMAIANSPLVKTAFHGADANWGRILSAAGAAAARIGLKANFDQASILINDIAVLKNGVVQGSEAEEKAQSFMRGEEFKVRVVLGPGKFSQILYTTDYSAEYIRINASYRS